MTDFPHVSKNLHGAVYSNPYQAPYALDNYTQNVPSPDITGGGPAYVNPQSVVDQHFFDPITPNDAAFSDSQPLNEISTADPIGAIMSDMQTAQTQLFNGGGK